MPWPPPAPGLAEPCPLRLPLLIMMLSHIGSYLGRCPSTVLRVALGRALIYEGNETVLGTNPNRTHDQPKPYLETAETVLDLYSDKGMFPLKFILRGAHKKKVNSLQIDAFPFSNRTRNRTRTAADYPVLSCDLRHPDRRIAMVRTVSEYCSARTSRVGLSTK